MRRVVSSYLTLALMCLVSGRALAQSPSSPFKVTGVLSTNAGTRVLSFEFKVPPEHVLYSDRLVFETTDGQRLVPLSIPEPVLHRNELTGQERLGYERDFSATIDPGKAVPLDLVVKFQGCSNNACYFPEKHGFKVTQSQVLAQVDTPTAAEFITSSTNSTVPAAALEGFRVAARETGYVPRKAFVGFLEHARNGQSESGSGLGARLSKAGPIASFLLILAGGIGLNLTPCVLPLIPINLAIIGAGVRASSRRKGFALGGVYGLGMAAVYGVLGIFVVLTGAKFGTLNSSPWFNFGIAAVFLVMALAMFGWLNVDFSRFQSRLGAGGKPARSQFALAFTMGAVAALLAGACVAPVVISVLLLAVQFYSKGQFVGLLLPFLLGFGMAAPWPFAGAGLSFLPKPGKWMTWVKYGFGVFILLFGVYYAHTGIGLLSPSLSVKARGQTGNSQEADQQAALNSALAKAKTEHRPVFIDFAASWCKNCEAMDRTVFTAAEVKAKLQDFVVVRYEAEKPNESPAREVLDRFGVMGLPTYLVLLPEK